jgi:hypothetical protein
MSLYLQPNNLAEHEEGSAAWKYQDEALKAMFRGANFGLQDLQNVGEISSFSKCCLLCFNDI